MKKNKHRKKKFNFIWLKTIILSDLKQVYILHGKDNLSFKKQYQHLINTLYKNYNNHLIFGNKIKKFLLVKIKIFNKNFLIEKN